MRKMLLLWLLAGLLVAGCSQSLPIEECYHVMIEVDTIEELQQIFEENGMIVTTLSQAPAFNRGCREKHHLAIDVAGERWLEINP